MGAIWEWGITCVQSKAAHVMTPHAALGHKKSGEKFSDPPAPRVFLLGGKVARS